MPDDLSPRPKTAEGPILTRRSLLIGGAAGAALLYGAGPAGATRSLSRASTRTSAGTVTFGSNGSDAVPKKAYANVMANFTKKTGIAVKTNTVDQNTFQEQINSYLQGKPDNVFTWFAGYRMQFFAQKGLATPIDDVWKTLTPLMPPAMKGASTGLDGHQYFVPIYNYPWAVFYRKSVFKKNGYTVPTTWDQFMALAKKMKADGLIDRLHQQGRLAGDGHVRHPQHADQRLPVPRRPDGRQGGLGQREGEGGLQPVEGAFCPTTCPARSG